MPPRPRIYEFDGWRLDTGERTLRQPDGTAFHITTAEFDILELLCRRPRKIVPREDFEASREGAAVAVNSRAIDVRMTRLRTKLRPTSAARFIVTISGRAGTPGGYYFAPQVRTVPQPRRWVVK